jgi:hypothetical protein
MSGKYGRRPKTRRFPAPGGMAEEPRGTLDPQPPPFRGPGDTSWSNGNNPAGNIQASAQFPHRRRVPPALLRGPDAMLHMNTPEIKAQFLPQFIKSSQHSA